MNPDLLEFIQVFISETWRLLLSFKIPGTEISVAVLLVGASLISIGLKFLSLVSDVEFGNGESYRSSSRRGKISEERQGDEK